MESTQAAGQTGTGSITVARHRQSVLAEWSEAPASITLFVGLASTTAAVWVPLAFLVGGTVFSVYS